MKRKIFMGESRQHITIYLNIIQQHIEKRHSLFKYLVKNIMPLRYDREI